MCAWYPCSVRVLASLRWALQFKGWIRQFASREIRIVSKGALRRKLGSQVSAGRELFPWYERHVYMQLYPRGITRAQDLFPQYEKHVYMQLHPRGTELLLQYEGLFIGHLYPKEQKRTAVLTFLHLLLKLWTSDWTSDCKWYNCASDCMFDWSSDWSSD